MLKLIKSLKADALWNGHEENNSAFVHSAIIFFYSKC